MQYYCGVYTHTHKHMAREKCHALFTISKWVAYTGKGKCAETWFMFQFKAIHGSGSVHHTAKYIWSEVIKYNPLQKSKMCAWYGFRLNRYRNTTDWRENWRKIEMLRWKRCHILNQFLSKLNHFTYFFYFFSSREFLAMQFLA